MKKKKVIKIVGLVALIFLLLNIVIPYTVYEGIFNRGDEVEIDSYYNYDYEMFKNDYKREEIEYSVGNYNLVGYSYLNNDTDYLIVTVHGFKDYADWLLQVDAYFLDNGYNVFSFDASGCGKSGGYLTGFSQTLMDLEKTLNFLNTDSRYKDYKKLLFGFSEGGYSVCSSLALNIENVYGVVAISAFNDAKNLVKNKGFEYVGPLVYLGCPLIYLKEAIVFNGYLDIYANEAINNSNTKVFLAHGTKDTTIPYDLSVIKNFEDSNRVLKYMDEATHTNILYSKKARDYQKEVKDNKIEDVNRDIYNELNDELFTQILDFYHTC